MRTVQDSDKKCWQAALLEASYGHIMLVFSPLEGDGIRQRLLDADHLAEAEMKLAALDDDQLRALLAEAQSWDQVTPSR